MAIITETKKIAVSLKLNNGTTETGIQKTVSQSLGKMNVQAFDAAKVYAIADALAVCTLKTVLGVEKVETTAIRDDS